MANYPTFTHGIGEDSSMEAESGIQDDFSQSGLQHSRLFYTGYYRFNLVHNLSMAEYTSLFATYTANPRANYTLIYFSTSPAVTYTVKFTGPPTITANQGLNRVRVEVGLRGTKN